MTRYKTADYILVALCLILTAAIPPLGVMISFLLVMAFLSIPKNRKSLFQSIGFIKLPQIGYNVIVCLSMAFLIEIPFQIFINPALSHLFETPVDLSAYDYIRGNFTSYLAMLMVGIIVGGFIEEILFRGYLITRISSLFKNASIGNATAILITSIVFGYSHLYQGLSGVISTGLISIILGIIFVSVNKNLWFTILTHSFINIISLTIIYLDLDKTLENLVFQ